MSIHEQLRKLLDSFGWEPLARWAEYSAKQGIRDAVCDGSWIDSGHGQWTCTGCDAAYPISPAFDQDPGAHYRRVDDQ